MTDNQRRHSPARRGKGRSLVWKSSLIASSAGAVLLGWALLGQAEATPASTAAQITAPPPRVIVVQVPMSNTAANGTQQSVRQPALPAQATSPAAPVSKQATAAGNTPERVKPQVSIPSMPQKPIFQQPVTRTRGS